MRNGADSEASKRGGRLARAMRLPLLAALAAALLLAGCSAQVDGARQQLDTVKQSLDEARAALDAARQEAREARDRYERVRSLEVVREERVDLVVRGVVEQDVLRFEVANATRSNGEAVPAANVTRLPLLSLESPDANGTALLCEPLTCQVYLPPGRALVAYWADAEDHQWLLENKPGVRIELTYDDAPIWATTSVGDATD